MKKILVLVIALACELVGQTRATAIPAVFNASLLRQIGVPLPPDSPSVIRVWVYDSLREASVYEVVTEFDNCGAPSVERAWLFPDANRLSEYVGVLDIPVRNAGCVLAVKSTVRGFKLLQ